MRVLNPKKSKRVLSLFSGCGGMDLGMEGGFQVHKRTVSWLQDSSDRSQAIGDWIYLDETSFQTVFANDIRIDAKTAWERYFSKRINGSDTYVLGSIVDLVKRARNGEVGVFPTNVDVVTGGFPCQDFSVAGKRKGFDSSVSHNGERVDDDTPSVENRGQLYIWMKEVIELTKPKVFIAENVKGLVNLKDVKDIIQKDFSSIGDNGYLVVSPKVLNASKFGVPQSRERVIFMGFLKSALTAEALSELTRETIIADFDPYPRETHGKGLSEIVNVFDVLSDLGEPEESHDLSHQTYSKAKYMGKHCQGQTEINLGGLGPTIRSEHHGNIEFRRLSKEHGGRYISELESGLKERRLSVRECARLQTFPDDYEFVFRTTDEQFGVSGSDAYKIIGNAVPPLLAFHIARNLELKWAKYFGDQ
jgi:DNA (cytosine-5)-methyltransferase 1